MPSEHLTVSANIATPAFFDGTCKPLRVLLLLTLIITVSGEGNFQDLTEMSSRG